MERLHVPRLGQRIRFDSAWVLQQRRMLLVSREDLRAQEALEPCGDALDLDGDVESEVPVKGLARLQ